jgi:hypothetical protein
MSPNSRPLPEASLSLRHFKEPHGKLLEQTAAATYLLNAQNVLTDPAAILLAGSIQVIDAQHLSILLYVKMPTGSNPVGILPWSC